MAKFTIKTIAEMSDAEVYKLSMSRPGHPKSRGFMLSAQHFKNLKDMAECMCALLVRLQKIRKNK